MTSDSFVCVAVVPENDAAASRELVSAQLLQVTSHSDLCFAELPILSCELHLPPVPLAYLCVLVLCAHVLCRVNFVFNANPTSR